MEILCILYIIDCYYKSSTALARLFEDNCTFYPQQQGEKVALVVLIAVRHMQLATGSKCGDISRDNNYLPLS